PAVPPIPGVPPMPGVPPIPGVPPVPGVPPEPVGVLKLPPVPTSDVPCLVAPVWVLLEQDPIAAANATPVIAAHASLFTRSSFRCVVRRCYAARAPRSRRARGLRRLEGEDHGHADRVRARRADGLVLDGAAHAGGRVGAHALDGEHLHALGPAARAHEELDLD